MRPAVGLFAFVHKEIDLKKMFMDKSKLNCLHVIAWLLG